MTPGLLERSSVRFGASFLANLCRAGLSFLSGLVVARALGAADYGNLTFLLATFASLSFLLDLGTTSAFYTFVSHRRQPPVFFLLYFAWTFGLQLLGTVIAIAFLLPAGATRGLWLGQSRSLVLLSLVSSFAVTQAWGTVAQLGEAARKTVVIQAGATAQALLHLVVVLLLVSFHALSVKTVLWLQLVEFAALALAFGPWLVRLNLDREPAARRDRPTLVKEFVEYCRPLAVFGLVSCGYSFTSRWLLQAFGGSAQQGYFALGQQLSAISLIATTSLLSVFWKEIAAARQRGDTDRIRELYTTSQRGLFTLAAFVSCALIPHTRAIVALAAGRSFDAAALPMAIMFLYPVHQSVGQLQTTMFLATGATVTHTRTTLGMMLFSLPLTYWVLAPPSTVVPGLGLGATGLAAELVLVQVAAVAWRDKYLERAWNVPSSFGDQVRMLGCFLTLGFATKWLASRLIGDRDALWPTAAGIAAYVLIATPFLLSRPAIARPLQALLAQPFKSPVVPII